MTPPDNRQRHPYDVEYRSGDYKHETRLNILAIVSGVSGSLIAMLYIGTILGRLMRVPGTLILEFANFIAAGLAIPAIVFGIIAIKFHNNAKRHEYIGSAAATFGLSTGLLALLYCYLRLWFGFGLL